MRYLIIICLVAMVLVEFYFYRRRIVSKGFWFCTLSEEFFLLLAKIEEIKNDPAFDNENKVIRTEHYRVTYYSSNYKQVFNQLDLLIAYLEDLYDSFEAKEKCFRANDWRKIQRIHKSLLDKKAHLKYKKWEYGYN